MKIKRTIRIFFSDKLYVVHVLYTLGNDKQVAGYKDSAEESEVGWENVTRLFTVDALQLIEVCG